MTEDVSSRLGGELDFTTEIAEASQEALDLLCMVTTREVIGTEIAVFDAVLEHVPDGREHRGGDREDGLLGTAASTQPQELSLQVRVLGPHSRPSGGHQSCFEPGGALTSASRAAFTGTFIVPRAHRRPGEQVSGGGEAPHVDADLGQDHLRGELTYPGHGGQQ